jgi:hypothetical protein
LESTQNKIESAAQKEKNERVKALLGITLTTGAGLIEELNKKDEDQAKRDAETWVKKTYGLIAAVYGDGEAQLFLDSSGYVYYGDGSEKSKIRNVIDGRMRRITELLARSFRVRYRPATGGAKSAKNGAKSTTPPPARRQASSSMARSAYRVHKTAIVGITIRHPWRRICNCVNSMAGPVHPKTK